MTAAIKDVPFYKKIFENIEKEKYELSDFPIVCKANYQENLNDFISVKYQGKQLHIIYTSGSTGQPMKIYKNQKDYFMQLKNVWDVRLKKYGIKLNDKELKFIFSNTIGNDIINIDENNNSMSINCVNITEEWLAKNYEIISNFAPKYCIGYGSIICNFMRMCENINVKFPKSIKYIELLGEYVFDVQKNYIKNNTKADVVNSYGTSEIFGIAYECKNGNLHCLNRNALVEIISDDMKKCDYGEVGNIVLTSYYSEAMPFIRYMIGDIGALRKSFTCSCGDCNDILDIKAGRKYDYVILESGEKKHAGFFYGIIGAMNKKFCDSILQFEIIQNSYNFFTVNLLVQKKYEVFSLMMQKEFVRLVNQFDLGEAEWKFNIILGNRLDINHGKYKFFKREFDK